MIERRERNHTCLILLFLLLVGCSPTKTVFFKRPGGGQVANYQVIEIPNFDRTDKQWVPYDSASTIPDMIAERLRTTNHFKEISRSGSSSTEGRVLLVKGTVTGYSRGCKFCEWFIRVNDKGKSSVSVRVTLVDKTTGDVIADESIEGRAKDPGFGESRYVRVVDEIVSLVNSVNRNES